MNTVIYASDQNLKNNPFDIIDITKDAYDNLVNHILKFGRIYLSSRPIRIASLKPFDSLPLYHEDMVFTTSTFGFDITLYAEKGSEPELKIALSGSSINSKVKKMNKGQRSLIRNQILEEIYRKHRELI